ncbi:hypothetical protein PNOK_0672000 [Pyrrhoderma noxium]|uniref:Uncharacterized protein n=1 Tax=Pyrrhoderma noxium TaxID=2282107 RepID=A0A286UFG3_9AGAM|nr:hypothetical protein PNOK_0672000 [Pyrrhoderma noxium]
MPGQKKGPLTTPPKYINDFSKALANEVRILLQEVGELRDERRRLQFEIAELMSVKSKHGAGGEYTPDWRPPPNPNELPAPPPPPPAIEEAPKEARPAWRTVIKHEPRKKRQPAQIAAAPAPVPVPAAPVPQVPAWAQWKPNPLITPQPRVATVAAAMPSPGPVEDDGLFGPKTPPPK